MTHPLVRLSVGVVAVASATAQTKPLFTFHSNAWLNLHHYTTGVERQTSLETVAIDPALQGTLERMCGAGCRARIVEHRGPRLDGRRSIADALAALVASFR